MMQTRIVPRTLKVRIAELTQFRFALTSPSCLNAMRMPTNAQPQAVERRLICDQAGGGGGLRRKRDHEKVVESGRKAALQVGCIATLCSAAAQCGVLLRASSLYSMRAAIVVFRCVLFV